MAWDKLTKWIVGRGLAEKSDRKKLEREYKEVEEVLKLIKEVVNEPILPLPSRPPSACSSPIPHGRKPREAPVLYTEKPAYKRSISSPAVSSLIDHEPATDLSYNDDLSSLKKNYSCNGTWTFENQPSVPMPEMTGFGRYRRSVNAPAEWQLERAVRSLHDTKGIFVDHLGDCPPLGMDPDIWRDYRAQHSRASSFASSHSSHSAVGNTVATEYLDAATGTKVSRGFCASTTSSAASSLKDGTSESQRDSNLSKTSMTSTSSDGDPKLMRRSRRISPLSRHASTTSISPLAVISELQEIAGKAPRKIEKPCAFDESGNNDNAVASDDDDELQWGDMLELDGGINESNLAKCLAQRSSSSRSKFGARPNLTRPRTTSSERPKSRASTTRRTVVDRSKTVRATTRAGHVRFQVPRKPSDSDKPVLADPANQTASEHHNQQNESGQTTNRQPDVADLHENMPVEAMSSDSESDCTHSATQNVVQVVRNDERVARAGLAQDHQNSRSEAPASSSIESTMIYVDNLSRAMPDPSKIRRTRSTTVCRVVSASCTSNTESTTSSKTVKQWH